MARARNTVDLDKLLGSPKAKSSNLLATENQATREYQRAAKTPSKRLASASDLSVRALTDMKAFAELIMFHGGWNSFGECHEDLVNFVCKPQCDEQAQQKLAYEGDEKGAYLRRLVLMPRGHLKSTIATVLYTLWRIYRNPDIRILVACHTQSLAYSFIRELRSHFENVDLDVIWNKRPHLDGALLPQLQKKSRDRNFQGDTEAEDRKVIWNNQALQVVRPGKYKEPTVFATSVGASVTGQHYDLIILDDLINFDNTESEAKKARVEEWIADIESVINPPAVTVIKGKDGYNLSEILGGEIIVNGTRYAVDDYYGQIIERQEDLGYQTHIRNVYKNGKDASEGFLWHEKYNERMLASLQARLSPRRFSSQYLNTVYEKDVCLFNTRAIQILPDTDVFTNAGRVCVRWSNGRIDVINSIIAIDPAFSTSKTSDDCAILIGGKTNDGTLVVVDAVLDRMVAAEVVTKTCEFADRWGTLRVFFEQNGVGMLVPEVFKNADVNGRKLICFGHYEQRNKESKIQGVLELPINAGKICLTQRVRDNERIWKQITNFPAVRHDDFLDGLVTLFEQSLPSRDVFDHSIRNVQFDPYRLGFERLFTGTSTPEESYLNQYSSYYG